MDRRGFLKASTALSASWVLGAAPVRAQGKPLRFADMHSHMAVNSNANLHERMLKNGMLLVPRTISADRAVIRHVPKVGFQQVREPQPGELASEFDKTVQRLHEQHAARGLVEVTDAKTLMSVIGGVQPAVIIASEGGDFLDGRLERLETLRAQGLVHVQLVHYRVSDVGDVSTSMPVHNGLSAFGKDVVRACNRLGMLVDVAHATHDGIAQALEISKRPILYSHGHLISGTPHWTHKGGRARGLSLSMGRRIAAGGGVVGIWSLASQYPTLDAYAGALLDGAAALGAAHVGLGTDLAGLPTGSVLSGYEGFPAIEELLAKRGVKPEEIAGMLGGNYLRVLQQALTL
jgi:membrane dipeptidase